MIKRNNKRQALDAGTISNQSYNEAAGVTKVAQAGLHLKPMPITGSTFSTDASTIRNLGKGTTVAFYNNSATVAAFRFSNNPAAASLAAGIVDNPTGEVGVAVPANSWFYSNTADKSFVITSASTLLTYVVEDDSEIKIIEE